MQSDVFIKLELELSFKNEAKKLNFPSTFIKIKQINNEDGGVAFIIKERNDNCYKKNTFFFKILIPTFITIH